MTAQEIYNELHKIDVIAELETKPGVWYIENSIDEYRSILTSFYATLKDAVDGLQESSDWFCPKGTGEICFREFGIGGKEISIYSGGFNNEWGKLYV